MDDKRTLHTKSGSVSTIHPLDFLIDQPIGCLRNPSPSKLIKRASQQPIISHQLHHPPLKLLLPVILEHSWEEMSLRELSSIIANLLVFMCTISSSQVRSDLKFRASVWSYFLKDENEQMAFVKDVRFPMTFLIITQYYNQLHIWRNTLNYPSKGNKYIQVGRGRQLFLFLYDKSWKKMRFGKGVFQRMSAAKVSRKAKRNGRQEKVVIVQQEQQAQKSIKKPASEKGSQKGSNKQVDVSETPVLQSQEAEMEEVYYYQAGDLVFATYLGLDWPGKILRPLKQYSLYRIQLFQLGKTVEYPIDVIKDYNQPNKEIQTKRFQNAENRHADLTPEKFQKAIEEADLAKQKLDEKQAKMKQLKSLNKHVEIEYAILEQTIQEEKEKDPFKPNEVEQKMGTKKKSKKQTNLQIKEYEKKIADRARQIVSKRSGFVQVEIEPVVEQSISYSIVIVGPEKPQQEQKPQEQKQEESVNENASKHVENPVESIETIKQQNKAEKGSVSEQQPSMKDQSVRSSQARGCHTDSQSNGLSEKQISSHIAQSLNHDDDEDYFKGNEQTEAQKEASEFIYQYEDQYEKLQKKLVSLPNLPVQTRVQICQGVLDIIMTEFTDSRRSDHYLPLLKTVLTKGVISLTWLVSSNILMKCAMFLSSYEKKRKNDAHDLQYRFLRQFRDSIISQPSAKDGASRVLHQKAIKRFQASID